MLTTFREVVSKHREIYNEIRGRLLLGYEPLTNKILAVTLNPDGSLPFTRSAIQAQVLTGVAIGLAHPLESTLVDETMTQNIEVVSIGFNSNDYAEFRIEVNGSVFGRLRSSYFERSPIFSQPFKLVIGDELKVAVKNESVTEESADFECYIYYREITS